MEGKPLYEYARENKPLPRAIPARRINISELRLLNFTPAKKRSIVSQDQKGDNLEDEEDKGHTYTWPKKRLDEKEIDTYLNVLKLAKMAGVEKEGEGGEEAAANGAGSHANVNAGEEDANEVSASTSLEAPSKESINLPDPFEASDSPSSSTTLPATFEIRMTVSSGTYVRSIIHDLAILLGSAAHTVKLTRIRQGQFMLYDEGDERWEALGGVPYVNGSGSASAAGEEKGKGKEEGIANGGSAVGTGTVIPKTDPSTSKSESEQDSYFIYDPTGPDRFDFGQRKNGCVPWSVWQREIDSRENQGKMTLKQGQEDEDEGDEEAMMASRRGDVKWKPSEWERELWARFVET